MSAQAYKEFRKKQAESPELRREFLDHLIQQAEDNGEERKVRELRAIKEREHTKDVHQRIKYAQGKLRGGGVRYIHKVDEEGNVETVKEKFRMEQEIMRANKGKLQMANESPI